MLTCILFGQETIHGRLWLCRYFFIFVAILVLVVTGYQYQDYSKINCDILRELKQQIDDMRVRELKQQIDDMRERQKEMNDLIAKTNGESPQKR